MNNETVKKNYPAKKEKEALNQIRKIMDGLGEVSHVRAAMDGVLEMAEDNIKKGIYCSPRKTIEVMQQTIQNMKEQQKADADIELTERATLWKKMDIEEIDIKKELETLDEVVKNLKNACFYLEQNASRIRSLTEITFRIITIYMLETGEREKERQDRQEGCTNS